MKRMHVLLLAVPLLLGACSAEESGADFQQGNIPVGFSGDVPATRAVKEYGSAADLTDIGVFASFTNGEFDATTATPNFMYNLQVTQSGGTWTYSPVKYWPDNDTDKLSFFAYAPYVDEATSGGSNPSFSGKTKSGYPTLTYTVPTAEAGQIDLLASLPLMNQTYKGTGGEIKFAMKHSLCKVSFNVQSEVEIKVTALSIDNAPSTATLTYEDGGFSWDNYTGTQTYTATLASGGTTVAANANAQKLATFFLLPNKATATFSITYTQTGNNVVIKKENITFPSASAWGQGDGVNYQLNVKKDGTVTATVGQEWTPGKDDTMTGKEKGISSAADWVAFTKLWNANGLPYKPDGTPDYSQYENYGWYETEGTNRVFTIKLTSSFVLTGVTTGELYTPVGTDLHPLTLPIDGQGWKISIDLQNSSQLIKEKYSGIVGYTTSDISNLQVVTVPGNDATKGYTIQSSDATYAGVLAGRVDGDMLNCSVELVKTTVVNTNTAATNPMYLGGLVGYCGGNIQNCAVYDSSSAASAVSFSQASAGSGIGGLAGSVASGKTVGNCYVRLSELSNQDGGDTPTAGWLAGSKAGVGFSTCHYMTGNSATGCAPDDSSAGITTFTNFTGLCASLNTEAGKHTGWALWKEITNSGGKVEQVTLDLYR